MGTRRAHLNQGSRQVRAYGGATRGGSISTGRSAVGTASRRRVPASQLRADHLDVTWLTSITIRSGPVRVET
jgi:hypothetical protein